MEVDGVAYIRTSDLRTSNLYPFDTTFVFWRINMLYYVVVFSTRLTRSRNFSPLVRWFSGLRNFKHIVFSRTLSTVPNGSLITVCKFKIFSMAKFNFKIRVRVYRNIIRPMTSGVINQAKVGRIYVTILAI